MTGVPVEGSWIKRQMHAAIIFYQRAREGQPSPCRFFPSCSSYALEAIDVHGPWRGGWLTARRLLRCRPLGPSGFDPVPEKHDAPSSSTAPSSSKLESEMSRSGSSDHADMLSADGVGDRTLHRAARAHVHCSDHSPAQKGG